MTVDRVRVGEVLRLERVPVDPDPMMEYVAIGVRSFGKGIFHYEPTRGNQLGSLRFFEVLPDRLVVSNIKGWEGAIAVSSEVDASCVASNRFLSYLPIDDRIDVRWACWFFLAEPGIELIRRASPGSADRNRTLAIERFEALEIPLPPIDEQRRVADRLDQIASSVGKLDGARGRSFRVASAIPLSLRTQLERGAELAATRLGDVLELVRDPVDIDPVATYVSIGIRSFGKGVFHYPPRPGAEIGKLRFQSVAPRLLAVSNIKAWEGAVATAEEVDGVTVASNRFLLFRPVAGEDATDYFWSLLLGSEGIAALGRASPGSADRNRTLAVDRFRSIELSIPGPGDQAAIGRRIRDARTSVARYESGVARAGARVEALVPAALNQAFASLS